MPFCFKCSLPVKFLEMFIFVTPLIIFIFIFGTSMSFHIRYRDNSIYKKLCKEKFHQDYMVCFSPHEMFNISDKDAKISNIDETSTTHVFAMLLLKVLIECLSSSFLCSWSDIYGRKLPLLIALIGQNFDLFSFFFSDFPVKYFIWSLYILSVLSGLFGGCVCIFTMTYCYLTDNTSVKDRILAFTMIDFGYMLGIIAGVVVFKKLMRVDDMLASFLTVLAARCILIIWMLLTFVEKNADFKKEKFTIKIRALFMLNNLKEIFKALTKWRKNCGRKQLALIACSTIPVMISYSLIEGVVFVITIHQRLFKNKEDYENYTLYLAVFTCFAEFFAILILQFLFKFKDSTLGIIGFIHLYLECFIGAFANDNLTFLVGLGLTVFKGFSVVALRSQYSKISDENERGKLFFVYCFCEVLATVILYFIYERLPKMSTPADDFLHYMIMAFFMILPLCTFVFQMMSIYTDHLFADCYRTLPIDASQNTPDLAQPESR